MINYIRSRIGVKLLLSYLVVIVVGMGVIWFSTGVMFPFSYMRMMGRMDRMMPPPPIEGECTGEACAQDDLYFKIRSVFNETFLNASFAAITVGIIASLLISRGMISTVKKMSVASQRIAEGHYHDRVDMGERKENEMDELGKLALNFNQMTEKLEKTEAMRIQMIGDVAHELRTPLTVIKGSMEGLTDGVLEADAETFQQIYRETDRLQRLVGDLQELSRVEAGAFELKLSRQDIRALVKNVADRLARQFDEKGVKLEVRSLDNELMVEADEDRIGQVLINLIGNALQYTPGGGSVIVEVGPKKREVWVTIQDTGIGIAPEHLEQIFYRFYRVDKSRSRVGGSSGVGLTIAKYLVEAHHGRIWVESEGEGQGSRFTFVLPLAS